MYHCPWQRTGILLVTSCILTQRKKRAMPETEVTHAQRRGLFHQLNGPGSQRTSTLPARPPCLQHSWQKGNPKKSDINSEDLQFHLPEPLAFRIPRMREGLGTKSKIDKKQGASFSISFLHTTNATWNHSLRLLPGIFLDDVGSSPDHNSRRRLV